MMMKDKRLVLNVNMHKADEAHFLISAVCAVMAAEYGMSRRIVAQKLKIGYFAAKEVLGVIAERGVSDTGYVGKSADELIEDLGSVLWGIKEAADGLGYPVNDERSRVIEEVWRS